ncbi:MAG: type II toxin-antitoxin system RelE/ParE family toxin [Mogibacterium sp.]|nr:type II toxin-antitoxin system RelE/ParE family toxin [Mogibacterium sp.]
MLNSKYKLRYLPLFYEDLNEKVEYIAYEKLNPDAALRLIDNVEAAILERLPDAESFEQYPSMFARKYPYYRIYVGNFIIFYVVIDEGEEEKTMEVRRFLYVGQDRDSKL